MINGFYKFKSMSNEYLNFESTKSSTDNSDSSDDESELNSSVKSG